MFRGKFKFKNSSGASYTYNIGDVVLHQGRLYKAVKNTKNSPFQILSDWSFLSITEPYRGTYPPVNPKENQVWISDDGINYVYFYDGDTYQWIAI